MLLSATVKCDVYCESSNLLHFNYDWIAAHQSWLDWESWLNCHNSILIEMQHSALQSRDCLYSLREQMCMSVYRESETIYLTHTEILRSLLFLNNNQSKRCCLDSWSDDICLRSKLQVIWMWEICSVSTMWIWKSDENQNKIQISGHAESILWLVGFLSAQCFSLSIVFRLHDEMQSD